LFDAVVDPTTGYPSRYQTTNGWASYSLAETFVEQAFVNGETSSTDCVEAFEALADDGRRVVDPCSDGLDPECAIDPENEIDARTLECDPPLGSDLPLDDLAQALVGMHPRDVWVTRLEANLVREALADDLGLAPAESQVPISGPFQAGIAKNMPDRCQLSEARGAVPPSDRDDSDRRGLGPLAPLLFAPALGLLLLLRRLFPASARNRRVRTVKPLPGRVWGVAK